MCLWPLDLCSSFFLLLNLTCSQVDNMLVHWGITTRKLQLHLLCDMLATAAASAGGLVASVAGLAAGGLVARVAAAVAAGVAATIAAGVAATVAAITAAAVVLAALVDAAVAVEYAFAWAAQSFVSFIAVLVLAVLELGKCQFGIEPQFICRFAAFNILTVTIGLRIDNANLCLFLGFRHFFRFRLLFLLVLAAASLFALLKRFLEVLDLSIGRLEGVSKLLCCLLV